MIESRIAELLDRPSSVAMPPWPKGHGHDEGWYNKQVAAQPGYLLLDQDTVRTGRFRGGGLEMADVLGPDGQFIYVKKADKTAPPNHLFAQGRVAIETLRFDAEAREKFLAKLPTDHSIDLSFRSPTVVYCVMLKDGAPLTSTSLFAFAKVSLLHAARYREWVPAWRSSPSRERARGLIPIRILDQAPALLTRHPDMICVLLRQPPSGVDH